MTQFLGSRKPDFRAGRQVLTYDDYWARRGFETHKKLSEREVIIRDHISPGSSVLVVGCGTSRLPFALQEKGCMVTVSDIAPAAVALFIKEGISGFVLDLERVEATSVTGTYDVIIASEVLEHIRNPERAVEALSKHTKRFIISVPNSAFYRYRLHLMFAGRFFVQWAHHPAEHLRYWSHSDFLEWLSAMDLSVQAAIPSNGLSCKGLCPFMKDLWPNLFGHQIVYDCTVVRK
ncbi:MAG TPA: methionine biosynthesis protein MetW [Candidatus Paceibacterota bacterium]|nr:methionine biosynthesis protein MetW [Candidatus Paceibacterota bacterium]